MGKYQIILQYVRACAYPDMNILRVHTYYFIYLFWKQPKIGKEIIYFFFHHALSCYSFEIVLFVNLEYLSQKEKKPKYVRGKAVLIQKFLC